MTPVPGLPRDELQASVDPPEPPEVVTLVVSTFGMSTAPTSTIVLKGDLDLSSVKMFERTLKPAIAHGGPITMDASGLMFMDSTGLRLFLHTANRLRPGSCLIVHGLNARVRRVFDLAVPNGIKNIHLLDHAFEEDDLAS